MKLSRLLFPAIVLLAVVLAAGVVWRIGPQRSAPRASSAKLVAGPPTKSRVATNGSPSIAPTATGATPPNANSATPAAVAAPAATAAPQVSVVMGQPPATPEGPPAPVTVGDIQFLPWEYMPTTSVTQHTPDYDMSTSYAFRRVGRFVSGSYKGAELLLAFVIKDDGPCKGEGCYAPYTVRYIQQGTTLFTLPKLSDSHAPDESVGRKSAIDLQPLKALGGTSAQPLDYSLPVLEYPSTLSGGPRKLLQFATEGVGNLDASLLQVAFHDPVYGDVWMTKPGAGPQKAFYEDCTPLNGASPGDSDACADMRKYRDNAFYLFRPDGTYLKYEYAPDFRPADPQAVTWSDGIAVGTPYNAQTLVGCSWDVADDVSVVSPKSVSEVDLEPIGKVNATADVLYGLKDKKHQLYQEFYDDYDSGYPTWSAMRQDDPTAKPVSYDDFVKARPLFLWKDPFGRLIRFVNTAFVIPQMCEPILYLYPEEAESVTVKLGEEIAVTRSYPTYRNGWSVSAQPDGRLMDLNSGRRSPYLFWEGYSYILPMETKGFVVGRSEVREFFERELPQLGLNEKETRDFISAWASKLTESPYYFITFLDRAVIDRYYPMQIEPAPKTSIRVFMDFTALSAPIFVPPLSLSPPPERRGFTVVEWGVVVR